MYHKIITNEIQVSLVILGTILFFYLYYYFAHSGFLKKISEKKLSGNQQKIGLFFMRKLSGFFILGFLPVILYYFLIDSSFDKFGLNINMFNANISVILILVCIVVIVLFINQFTNRQRSSVQIDIREWSILLFLFNAVGWTVYLIGYEFLFRGILLFECYQSFGFWPAIAINVVIYSAIHMVNGKDQAIGALIFGTIACYFTLTKGTLLIPVFMHVTLSVFSDYFSIRFNKKLKFRNSWL
jgi:membrane protease YdiL (CAAX protease family)